MSKCKWLASLLVLSAIVSVGAEEVVTRMPGVKPGVVVSDSVSIKATVTAIDQTTREVTLKGPEGNSVTLVAGDEVRNLAQINKGDVVLVDYLESVALFVRSPEEAPEAGEAAAVSVAPLGQKPAVNAVQTQEITATVLKVNTKTRTLVLKGTDGMKETVKIGPEVKRFDQIKKGDHVVTRITRAVAIKVRKP